MAAESIGMSQKKKDRAATIGMIIFFSILAILNFHTGTFGKQGYGP